MEEKSITSVTELVKTINESVGDGTILVIPIDSKSEVKTDDK